MAKTPGPLQPGAEMFGIMEINGVVRPILQRQATDEDACTRCRGFGTGGNPLCGAVYICEECKGTGLRQPGQPPYVPPKPAQPPAPEPMTWWQRLRKTLWR